MSVPEKELQWRLQNLEQQFPDDTLSMLVLTLSSNSYYLTGLKGEVRERFVGILITSTEETVLVCPSFEKENYLSQSSIFDTVISWDDGENPYKKLMTSLDISHPIDTLWLDPEMKAKFVLPLMQELSPQSVNLATQLLTPLRIKKSPWELQQLKEASKISVEAIETAFDTKLKEGMTELELQTIVSSLLSDLSGGASESFALIQFGENSANPHGMPTSRKLRHGDVVLIDAGTVINGYWGDITITRQFGMETAKFREIYDIVLEANQTAIKRAVKGVTGEKLDSIARTIITEYGYGSYFTHRLGHGLGLEVHEPPYIVKGNSSPLENGNCHTIEPGIYLPGLFGVRIEDDICWENDKGIQASHPTR